MPRPSKCYVQLNISWEPSSHRDVVKIYFYFMKHLHFISRCTRFVNSFWVWLEVNYLMEQGAVSAVLRRGGEGHVHLNVCYVSGDGSWAELVANQGTQKSLPALGSLALLAGPVSWEEEEWQDSRDLWSLFTSALTVGNNWCRSAGPLSLLAKSGWEGHDAVPGLLKPQSRLTNSRECCRNAGATGGRGAARKIMRIRLLNSCSLTEHIVSCALNEVGSSGKKMSRDCVYERLHHNATCITESLYSSFNMVFLNCEYPAIVVLIFFLKQCIFL